MNVVSSDTPKETHGRSRPSDPQSRPSTTATPDRILSSGIPRHPLGHKEIKRHTSQPILNWFHRKISGNKQNSRKRHGKELSNSTNQADTETKLHADETPSRAPSTSGRRNPHVHVSATLSINSHAGSLGPSSSWSAKEPGEADEDASIRPIPPSIPPSPVPSRSTHSSSATSVSGADTADHPRASQSVGTTSTKPTTVMSIDLGLGGHIAQVVPSQSSVLGRNAPVTSSPNSSPSSSRFPRLRSSNTLSPVGASVSFNMGPNGASGSNRQASLPTTSTTLGVPVSGNKLAPQAPGLTHFHPKNNPRPASPPMDNASTLTLASSNFAMSHTSPRSRSLTADRDFGDANASMRALRPSSRRGSWGSDETGWSAAGHSTHTGISAVGPGGLLNLSCVGLKRRGPGSITTAWSYRTGGTGTFDGTIDGEEHVTEEDLDEHEGSLSSVPSERGGDITPTEEVSDLPCSPESVQCPEDIPLPPSPRKEDKVLA